MNEGISIIIAVIICAVLFLVFGGAQLFDALSADAQANLYESKSLYELSSSAARAVDTQTTLFLLGGLCALAALAFIAYCKVQDARNYQRMLDIARLQLEQQRRELAQLDTGFVLDVTRYEEVEIGEL